MRLTHLALAAALSLTFGTYTQAQGTCGELCSISFLKWATPAEISEAIAAVGVNARDEFGQTPLHIVAYMRKPQNVITLLQAGANLNARDKTGRTPLHIAAISGTTQNVIILFEAGANVNARDETGRTPLHYAAHVGTPQIVITLLEAGADATLKDEDGETPWDSAQKNDTLKGTDAYWALNDARFK